MDSRLMILTLPFLCAAVHAQACSGGGLDGGMDATGNQCAFEGKAVVTSPVTGRIPIRVGTGAEILAMRPYAVVTEGVAPALAMVVPLAVMPAGVTSGQQDRANIPTCSGGAEGGMDATGNLCAQAADWKNDDRTRGAPP